MKESKYNYYTKAQSKRGFFCYNFLTRAFIFIPNEIYIIIKNGNYTTLDQEDSKALLGAGVLVNEDVDEKYIMKHNFHKCAQYSSNRTVFISMTSTCNFSCSYCFEDCRKELVGGKYISKKNIDIITDWLSKEKINKLNVVYFGGEPLINMETLIYAIKQIDLLPFMVTHTIITNGFEIKTELIDILKKIENFNIQITLDGDKENHDRFRKTNLGEATFDKIFHNVLILTKEFPYKIVIRMNVTDDAYKYKKLIDRFYNSGLKEKIGISFSPIIDGQKTCHSYQGDILPELIEYATRKGFSVNTDIEMTPCMAKSEYSFTVDERNNIYSCPGELYQKTVGIFEAESGLNIKDSHWYSLIYDEKQCVMNCMYGPICYGGCVLDNNCRKNQIEMMMPFFIQQKIRNYNQNKGGA